MKKKGYTLAEALVAMGVVGVVAALMLPLMNKYKPDGDKALFIRTYDSIVEATSLMVNDREIYPLTEVKANEPKGCDETKDECNYIDYSRAPLLNGKKVILYDNTEIGDGDISKKLCQGLAHYMHAATDCSITGINGSSFKLINNVEITVKHISNTNSKQYYWLQVTLPTDNNKKFALNVLPNGQVIPDVENSKNEKTTISYLMTRANWKKGSLLDDEVIEKEKQRYKKLRDYVVDHAVSIERCSNGNVCSGSES